MWPLAILTACTWGTAVCWRARWKLRGSRGCTSAVFTFAPPLDRAVKGRAILTPEEKARRIAAMGVEHYVRPPFEEFCTLSPEAFVHDVLAVRFGAKAVFCGDNFTFGSRKAGNVDMLRHLCAAAGISVEIVPMVQREGAPVSSSRIRACLEAGDVETAGAMLGEPYCIDLPVRHGKRLGTALGFPTINQIYPDWMLLPRQGVYVTRVLLDGRVAAQCYGLGHAPHGERRRRYLRDVYPGFFRRYLRRQSAGALLPFFVAHAEIRYAGGAFGHGGPRRAGRAGVAGRISLLLL